jgi:hypothetical protein
MKPSLASFVLAFSLLFRHFVQLQIYTRPAGGLSPAGHFISLLRMYSFTMNLTCAPKFLSASSAIFCIFSAVSLSKRIDLIISPVVILLPPLVGYYHISQKITM